MTNWLLEFKIEDSDGTFKFIHLTVYVKNYEAAVDASTQIEYEIANSVCVTISELVW